MFINRKIVRQKSYKMLTLFTAIVTRKTQNNFVKFQGNYSEVWGQITIRISLFCCIDEAGIHLERVKTKQWSKLGFLSCIVNFWKRLAVLETFTLQVQNMVIFRFSGQSDSADGKKDGNFITRISRIFGHFSRNWEQFNCQATKLT